MFENAIGLDPLIHQLTDAIQRKTLPAALLFHGPRYSGKGTLALEIARVLTCRKEARWDCPCHSCSLHRTLSHPDVVMAGGRYFEMEMFAAKRAWEESPRIGTLYLVIRAARKALRRFDQSLWPEARVKKLQDLVSTAEVMIQEIEPASPKDALPKKLSPLFTHMQEVLKAMPHEIVPVDVVRNIATWSHVSSAGPAKVVILEEAHALPDGARNSMLKILEEPPENVWFILTTTRRGAIMPTLLSRLRCFSLPRRTVEAQQNVMRRVYRHEADVLPPSLDEFFRSVPEANHHRWVSLATRIAALHRGTPPRELATLLREIREELKQGNQRGNSEILLHEIAAQLRQALPSGGPVHREMQRQQTLLIQSSYNRIIQRNMNPLAVVTDLTLEFNEMEAGSLPSGAEP
jgi:DNA polymerase-3 subunit gamma/tau